MGKFKAEIIDSLYEDYQQEMYEAFDSRINYEMLQAEYEMQMENLKEELEKCKVFFVYGTLQKGCGNHRLLKDAKFIGQAVTTDKYLQTISGSIPYVNKNVKHSQIYGELYAIKSVDEMQSLDALESHPNWYKREVIETKLVSNLQTTYPAWIYFNDVSLGDDIIYDGDYKKYIKKNFKW